MSLGEMKFRLIADVLCWTLLTVVLLWQECPVAAAWTGSFGIVYGIQGVRKYRRIRKEYLERMRDMMDGQY